MTRTTPAADPAQRIVLVTGPSGAGRSTVINALEDLGFEVIDNLPLTLLPRLLEGPPLAQPMAIGVDVRTRDFSTDALIDMVGTLTARPDISEQLLYVDCAEDTIVQRYSETRRRHPLTPNGTPLAGIRLEQALLAPIRARADILIDTTALSPHDLRAEIESWFAPPEGRQLSLSIQSFSFKRGLPRGLDIVHDVRFLRNPHWKPELRALNGRDAQVAAYVAEDPRFAQFFDQMLGLTAFLLPAYRDEGKAHLSIGFGCTGGQHRSVALAERLAEALAAQGWTATLRHRELERKGVLSKGAEQ